MGRNYSRDIYRQLQEFMERSKKLERELGSIKTEQRAEVTRLTERISTLEKEVDSIQRENQRLTDDNERMKRILNNNRANSSLPPSMDEKVKKANTYNSREKSGKKCGGQKGNKGSTLTKETIIKKIGTGEYRHKIVNIGELGKKYISKYVIDVEIQTVATEYRFYENENGKIIIPEEYHSDVTYGSIIKSIAVGLYSEGVVSNDRICSFINALSGGALEISEGSIYGFCHSFADKSEGSICQIIEELLNSHIIDTDATNVTKNG